MKKSSNANNMNKKIKPKILFLDILTDDPKIKDKINKTIYKGKNYSESMRKMFSLGKDEWTTCDAATDKFPENPENFDAVVIGGSTMNPVPGEEKPWMKETFKFIKKIINKEIPLLAICGGLQFTIRAFGKKIITNPKGREFGTLPIVLTKKGQNDPLFQGLPKNISACLSHKCMVEKVDKKWKLLASSKLCAFQAFAIGDNIRLTQFHPEMKTSEIKTLAKTRKEQLLTEKFLKNNKEFNDFIKSIKNTDKIGKKIIKNFITYFVLPHKKKKMLENSSVDKN